MSKILKKCALGCLFTMSLDSKNANVQKDGISYDSIKNQIQPLDVIFFRGDDVVSNAICTMEKSVLGNGDWSHCGIVLTADIIPIKNGNPNELYIWESTFDLVKDVELDDYVFGVQIRRLDEVLHTYSKSPDTKIAWCKLKDNPLFPADFACAAGDINKRDHVVNVLQNLYLTYNHVCYNYNLGDLFSTLYPSVFSCLNGSLDLISNTLINKFIQNPANNHPLRKKGLNAVFNGKKASKKEKYKKLRTRLFCSELVSLIYVNLGILPPSVNPSHIAPVELLGYTNEDVNINVLDPSDLVLLIA